MNHLALLMTIFSPLALCCYRGGAYNYHRARARAAQLRRDSPVGNLTAFDESNSVTQDYDFCSSYSYSPYTAIEMRSVAAVQAFPDEAELPIQEGGRLTCSFDNPQEFCSWHNINYGHLRFWKGSYDVAFDRLRFECTSPRKFNFDGGFLIAGGEPTMGNQKVAIETEIECLYEDSTLKFDIWSNSDEPVARFCLVRNFGGMECKDLAPAPNPMNISIPQSGEPFKLKLEILNLSGGAVVLIDNLYFEGRICELVPDDGSPDPVEPTLAPDDPVINVDTSTSSKAFAANMNPPSRIAIPLNRVELTTTIRLPTLSEEPDSATDELSACEALTCNFNEDHSCFYGLSGIGSTYPWISSHYLIGNRHTGIQRINLNDPKELGFVYVGENRNGKHDSETFVMESPKFTLKTNIFVVFDFYLRSKGPTLKVCLDSFDYCPYRTDTINPKVFWKQNEKVFIPPGTRKLYFLAENLKGNHFLAVDNIRVEAEDGSDVCDA